MVRCNRLQETLLFFYIFLFIAACSSCVIVCADEALLDEVHVEAESLPEFAFKVLTDHQMHTRQERLLAQTLRRETSLNISSQGNEYGNGFIFFRGAPSQGTTILSDGVSINTQSELGRSSLGGLTSLDLEEVRVLPGASVQTGSHALGGTIALITKQGRGVPSSFSQIERGSFRTTQAYHALQGERENVDFFVSGTLEKTGLGTRFNAVHGNRVSDEGELRRMSTNVGVGLTPQVTLRLIAHVVGRENALDDFSDTLPQASTNTTTFFQARTQGTLTQEIAPRRRRTLMLHQERFENRAQTPFPFSSRSQSLGVRYGEFVPLTRTLDGWAEYDGVQDGLHQSNVSQSEQIHTATLGARATHARMVSQAEVKAYFVDAKNPEFSYAMGLDIPLSQETLVFIRHSLGIKRPLLLERFGIEGFQLPNPKLMSQKGLSVELGFEKSFFEKKVRARTSVFATRFQDLLLPTKVAVDLYQTRNAGKRWVQGVEGSVAWAVCPQIETQVSYTYIAPRVKSGQDTPTQMARHQLSASVVWSPKSDWSIFADAQWRSAQKDYAFLGMTRNDVSLPPYMVMRAGASYEPIEHIKIFGRVENALDKAYEASFGYGARGRSITVGASIKL